MGLREAQERAAGEQLRDALREGLARSGLTMSQVEARSGLGHTTVSNALNRVDLVPSERTVAALAKALGLDGGALLTLRRVADAPRGEPEVQALGVPIGRCDPFDLEVHPAGPGPQRGGAGRLPGYVREGTMRRWPRWWRGLRPGRV